MIYDINSAPLSCVTKWTKGVSLPIFQKKTLKIWEYGLGWSCHVLNAKERSLGGVCNRRKGGRSGFLGSCNNRFCTLHWKHLKMPQTWKLCWGLARESWGCQQVKPENAGTSDPRRLNDMIHLYQKPGKKFTLSLIFYNLELLTFVNPLSISKSPGRDCEIK